MSWEAESQIRLTWVRYFEEGLKNNLTEMNARQYADNQVLNGVRNVLIQCSEFRENQFR